MNNKKVLYIVIVMHTLFFMFAIVFLKMQKEKNINKYLAQLYINNKITFDKEVDLLNKNMDLLEQVLIDKKVLKLVKMAYSDFNTSRLSLIKIFMPKYEILEKNGFYLVHFHLVNGKSLVRFHNLSKYNDKLFGFRPSIKYVQRFNKVFHGFEIGRGVGGFRSVYPLVYQNKVIGSFEISFSIDNMIHYMLKNEHFAIVVKKDIIDKRVFKNDLKLLRECKINKDYYIWGNACELFEKDDNIEFNKKINIVQNNIVFSYPLYDLNKKNEGYILNVIPYDNVKVINEINTNFKNMLSIVLVLYFVLLLGILAVYYYIKAKNVAEKDYLTRLLNRKGCMKNIKKIDKYTLLILDIDHFKKINDTYGHDKGDFVLKEIASLFSKNLRKTDIVCRWGGEEFLVILPDLDIKDALKVAEKLREIIANHDFNNLKITISIGVNEFENSFENTFKKADEKLYKAKEEGRNRVIY